MLLFGVEHVHLSWNEEKGCCRWMWGEEERREREVTGAGGPRENRLRSPARLQVIALFAQPLNPSMHASDLHSLINARPLPMAKL